MQGESADIGCYVVRAAALAGRTKLLQNGLFSVGSARQSAWIAPRRSPVRVRLAPSKSLQMSIKRGPRSVLLRRFTVPSTPPY